MHLINALWMFSQCSKKRYLNVTVKRLWYINNLCLIDLGRALGDMQCYLQWERYFIKIKTYISKSTF